MNYMNDEKIKGTIIGGMIGDCLGLPFETWDATRIANTYGKINKIYPLSLNTVFNDMVSNGSYSDDTQLTISVMQSICDSKGLNMDSQAAYHVSASRDTTLGWGETTKNSVYRIANGMHWSDSGNNKGFGNGVAMKVAPIALYASRNEIFFAEAVAFVNKMSKMTHGTNVSACAALAQMAAVSYCAINVPDTFNMDNFINYIIHTAMLGVTSKSKPNEPDIISRLELLKKHKDYTKDKIIAEFNGGDSSAYNTVPFVLMMFINGYRSIDCLYDVVSAGGDTDTNGCMIGSLFGALHGVNSFPSRLLESLNKNQYSVLYNHANILSQFLMKTKKNLG